MKKMPVSIVLLLSLIFTSAGVLPSLQASIGHEQTEPSLPPQH